MDRSSLEQQASEIAVTLKTMAHADRLIVLCELLKGSKTVSELQEMTTLSQSAFSQHLKVLRDHGLVSCERRPPQVIYSISNSKVAGFIDAIREHLCDSDYPS